MPENHLKPWTADEVSELQRLAAKRLTVSEIASALGRTQDAVSRRLKPETTGPRPISLKPPPAP